MKKLIALLLVCVMAVFTACSAGGRTANLMEEITPGRVDILYAENTENRLVDFSANLFAAGREKDKNTLISPASMLYVLAMISNGADGETLSQLENAFGCDVNDINNYLSEYMNTAENIAFANSLWIRDGFTAAPDFLQINADYFGAGIYTAPFDASTVKDINNYVKQNTDGMIEKIIDRLDPSTVMCLINALTFEDEWQDKYEKRNIYPDVFTAFDGTDIDSRFMYSTENTYLYDENTTGFVKRYKNGSRFVALLPDENADINDYIASLDGEKLTGIMNSAGHARVMVHIPVFESEYSNSMIETMEKLGVCDLFDGYKCDLSEMGESDTGLYISRLLHKTYISVDEKGTKAAAITFATADESAAEMPEKVYTVKLNRPFVYMILPRNSNLPLFTGSVLTTE